MREKKFIVVKANVGLRMDAFVSKVDNDLSRTMVQKLIKEKNVLVNGVVAKSSYKVKEKDEVIVKIEEPKETTLKAEEIPLDVVYEDDDILVINKQKGMVVHPGNGNPDGTLVNAVLSHCKGSLSGIGGELRPGIVHRIDKDTSGFNYSC